MGSQLKLVLFVVFTTILVLPETQSKHRHKSYPSRDLIVSVHHSIPQDKKLIHHLQEILKEASKLFHEVTDNLILSETIKIVIPHSWVTYPVSGYSNNVEDVSDIRIENYLVHDERKDAIYTIQPGGCGQHGSYISMTPEFLRHKTSHENNAAELVQHILQYKFGIYEHLNLFDKSAAHNLSKLQEDVCHGKSGWQVIKKELETIKHEKKNHSFKLNAKYKVPQLQILQTLPANTYTFLVDASYDFWNKTTFLPTMLDFFEDFVKHTLPMGSTFGYVLYSDHAKVVHNLTRLSAYTSFGNLSEDLKMEEKGSQKNLYAGIEACLQEHTASNRSTIGGRIILLTDLGWHAQHSVSDSYKHKVAQLLVTNGFVLNSFVLSGHHHQHHGKLEELSHHTGGQFYIIEDEEHLKKHGMEMLTTLAPENVMISSEESNSFPFNQEVYIESHMEGTSQIYIEQDVQSHLGNIQVTSPKGVSINSTYHGQEHGKQRSIFKVRHKGMWNVSVEKENDEKEQTLQLKVVSRPGPMASPVRLSAWIKEHQENTNHYSIVQVFAQLQSVSKLHHLNTTAEITAPSGNKTHLKLKDSGLGADIVSGDGIYSAYFTHFHGKGRYEVAVRVSGKHKENKTSSELEEFHRYAYAGTFWIYKKYSADVIPPAPVRDLQITSFRISEGKDIISVNWTAVGDNMDHGKVADYELRITNSHKESDFGKWHRIVQEQVTDGSLVPLQSGHEQKVSFTVPQELLNNKTRVLHIALKSHDHNNNTSDLSNVASIHLPTKIHATKIQKHHTLSTSTVDIISTIAENKGEMTESSGDNETEAVNQKELATSSAPAVDQTTSSFTNETISNVTNPKEKSNTELSEFTRKQHEMDSRTTAVTEVSKSESKTNAKVKITVTNSPESTESFSQSYGSNNKSRQILFSDKVGNTNFSLNASDKPLEVEREKEKVRFAYVNIRVSTLIASFVAGMTLMFFIMAIVAAYIKNKKKKNTYNIKKSEEDFVEAMALNDSDV